MWRSLLQYSPGWPRWIWLFAGPAWLLFWHEKLLDHPWASSRLEVPYAWFVLAPAFLAFLHGLLPTRLGWIVLSTIAAIALVTETWKGIATAWFN